MLIKKLFSLTSINIKNLEKSIKMIIFEVGKQMKAYPHQGEAIEMNMHKKCATPMGDTLQTTEKLR